MADNRQFRGKTQSLSGLLFVAAIVSFEVVVWLLTSGMEYEKSRIRLPMTTAGWFLIGQFILLPVSAGYAGLFALLSRFVSRKAAAVSLIVISLVLAAAALKSALPQSRFKAIVGEEVAANTILLRLNVYDSFNDGITSVGEFVAQSNAVESLVKFRRLDKSKDANLSLFLAYCPKPPGGVDYSDKHGHFSYDMETEIMYFVCSGQTES